MALFANFGVGSRERSGFAGTEVLEDLLRRHLIFDAEKACRKLTEMAREDLENQVTAQELKQMGEESTLIDVRSAELFARCQLPGARLFSAETVKKLSPNSQVVVLCNDGSQAPAGSRFLRGQGWEARHLKGGLRDWAARVDSDFPILYPLEEEPGCWHLLADHRTLRLRISLEPGGECRTWTRSELLECEELSSVVAPIEELEMVIAAENSLGFRGLPQGLNQAVELLKPFRAFHQRLLQGGTTCHPEQDRERLKRVLAEVAPEILKSHKGTVEVKSYLDRCLTLELGGGCAGCASAQITTQRELAGALYDAVPALDRIKNASL